MATSKSKAAPIVPVEVPVPVVPALRNEVQQNLRILVVGISGYIGSAIALGLRDTYEVFGTYNATPTRLEGVTSFQLDVFGTGTILDVLRAIEPDVVFYCIGPGEPEFCEKDKDHREMADALLLKATSLFSKVAVKPFRFVYFSSDQVMSDHTGETAPFAEKSAMHPVNHFGQLKSQAEALILGQGRQTYVFRLGHLFGETMGTGPNFRSSSFQKFADHIYRNEKMLAARDRTRSFIYLGEVIRAIRAFLVRLPETSMLYNLAPPDALTDLAFAETAAKIFKWNPSFIKPFSLLESNDTAVPIPRNSSLNSGLFEKEYDFKFAKTRDAVFELWERLYRGQTKTWQ